MNAKRIALLVWTLLLAIVPIMAFAQNAAETEVITHTIAEGENLYTIADQYSTTVETLNSINGMTADDILQIGRVLTVSGVVPLPAGLTVIDDSDLAALPGYPPVPKIHRIAAGDSLGGIAQQYDVALDLLALSNNISTDTLLQLGDTLLIPGATGELIGMTHIVEPGDTLDNIAARYNSSADQILRTDAIINPAFLPIGLELPIISRTGWDRPRELNGRAHIVGITETITTIAAQHNLSPVLLAQANGLAWPGGVPAGMRLIIPGEGVYRGLPADLTAIRLSNTQPNTGETISIRVSALSAITPTGRLRYIGYGDQAAAYLADTVDQTIPFAAIKSEAGDQFVGLVGLDAFAPAGLYQLELTTADQTLFAQPLQVNRIDYGFQAIPLADSRDIRAIEDAFFADIYANHTITTALPLTGSIAVPVEVPYVSADYGAARSYAGQPVSIFHSGVDYAAPVNTPIKAVAGGVVRFSAFTELRGNVVIVDHGWGVMSAYFHMEARLVEVGEIVGRDQAIGSLGNTGLSTGAHLHWEMVVHGVSVNGAQWLREPLP